MKLGIKFTNESQKIYVYYWSYLYKASTTTALGLPILRMLYNSVIDIQSDFCIEKLLRH